MANKKEYEIIINGVTEATQNVETLGDALNRLTGTVETHSEGIKKASSSIDELAKTELKITQYNEEYNRALQTNKAVLSDKNKAIKEELDLENANIIVQENIQNTYKDKQTLLTALGKVIKNTNAQTDEEKEKLTELKTRYANVNQELKNFDAELGNHQRNVGNYSSAFQELKQKIKEGTAEMAVMRAQGINESDEAFRKLAQEVGGYKDALDDAKAAAKRFASDTKVLDDVVNVAQSATAAFQLWKGAMTAFNIESEEATKTIQELMSVMSLVQGLQTFTKTLQSGTATSLLLSKASKALKLDLIAQDAAAISAARSQEGLTTAQKAGTIATKTLSMAIKAIPLMFVIGLVTTLITHWEDLVGWFEKTFPATKKLGGVMNGLKAVFMGVGKAIVNWLINPLKTMADVMKKLFEGDLKGAVNAAMDGIKNQFVGTAKAFKEGFQNQVEKGLEDISMKTLEETNKQTKYQLEMLKAQKGNQAKFSKEGIALQKKEFEERKKLAKGNQEELRKINIEEANFHREIEENKTKAEEAELKKRQAQQKKYADEEKKRKAQEEKDEKERLKREKELYESYVKSSQKLTESKYAYEKAIAEKARTVIPDITVDFSDGKIDVKGLDAVLDTIHQEIMKQKKLLQVNEWMFGDLFSDEQVREVENGLARLGDIYQKLFRLNDALKDSELSVQERLIKVRDIFKIVGDDIDEFGDLDVTKIERPFSIATKESRTLLNEIVQISSVNERLGDGVKAVTDIFNNFRGNVSDAQISLEEFQIDMVKLVKLIESSEQQDIIVTPGKIQELSQFSDIFKNLPSDKVEYFLGLVYDYRKAMNDLGTANEKMAEENTFLTDTISKSNDRIQKYIDNVEDAYDEMYNIMSTYNVKIFDNAVGRLIHNKDYEKYIRDMQTGWRQLYDEATKAIENIEAIWESELIVLEQKYGKNSDEYVKAVKKMEAEMERLIKLQSEAAAKMPDGTMSSSSTLSGDTQAPSGGRRKNKFLNEDGTTNWDEFLTGDLYEVTDKITSTLLENVFDPIGEAFSALLEFEIEEAQEALDEATKMHDKSVEAIEASKSRLNEISEQMKNANASELESLKSKQADEMLLLAQREAEEKRLAREKERREKELEKKQKQQKKLELKMELVEGIINTAVGVTKALTWGFPLGPIFAAIIGAMGAVQTALIAKQISKLEDGGLLKGRSHANGGMRIQGTNIEVEGGEYVVNKRSTKKYLPLLQAINEEGRTASYNKPIASHQMMKYANGGELNYQRIDSNLGTMDTNKVIQNSISDIDMHPVVSVVDINRGVKNLTQVRQMAGASK